jgi:lysozyme
MHSRKTVLTLSKLSSGLRRLLGRPRSAPSATSGQLSSRTVAALLLVAATGLAGCSSTGLEDSLQPIGNAKKQAAQSAKPNVKKLDPPGNGRYGDHKPVDFGKRHPDLYPSTASTCRNGRATSTGRRSSRAGVAFAFIKSTEGGDHNDSRFQ